MVAARIAGSIAVKIGIMRVTGQVEALVTLPTNLMRWLVTPCLLARHPAHASAGRHP